MGGFFVPSFVLQNELVVVVENEALECTAAKSMTKSL
jgi:hypothetical protein